MLSGPWTQILIDCTGTLTLANEPSTFAFHTLGRMRAPHWEWMISQGARIEGPSLHVRLRLTLNDDCPDIQNASTTSACFGCFGFGFGFEFGFVFIYVSESHGKHSIATYRADCRTAFERCQVFTARLLWLFAPVSCSSASAVLWIWQRLLQFEPTWRPRGEFPTSVRGELTTRALSVRSDEESSAIRERTVGQEVRRRDTRSLEGLAGVYVMLQRIHRK